MRLRRERKAEVGIRWPSSNYHDGAVAARRDDARLARDGRARAAVKERRARLHDLNFDDRRRRGGGGRRRRGRRRGRRRRRRRGGGGRSGRGRGPRRRDGGGGACCGAATRDVDRRGRGRNDDGGLGDGGERRRVARSRRELRQPLRYVVQRLERQPHKRLGVRIRFFPFLCRRQKAILEETVRLNSPLPAKEEEADKKN